jgi:hypothetical protein
MVNNCPLLTAKFAPPTVGETKKKFMTGYSKPIPSIYSTVVQELLVQMHFITYHINYEYNEARKGVVRRILKTEGFRYARPHGQVAGLPLSWRGQSLPIMTLSMG